MIPSLVLLIQKRKTYTILMDGKGLDISSKRKTTYQGHKQSKIRQVRHAKKYMFGFLIPRNYIEAWEFDKASNNSKWYDATKAELDSIHSYQVFQKHEKAQYDKQKKVINAPLGYQKIRVHLIVAVKYDGRHKARLVAD